MRLPGGELLIVACSDNPGAASEIYAKRRQIETMSACLKSRGFGFESAHLKNPERISRLPAIVCIAFVRVYLIGNHLCGVKPVAFKKHGFRAQSVFRYGSDYLRKLLFNIADRSDEFVKLIQVFDKPSRIIFVR